MSYLYHTKITLEYFANTAFFIRAGNHRILLDSFFSRRVMPFSAIPADLMNDMLEGTGSFSGTDLILATHCHKDHCDEDDLINCKLNASVIIPKDAFSGYTKRPALYMIYVGDPGAVWEDDEIMITAVKTEHAESNIAAARLHFSYIIHFKQPDKYMVIMGDAEAVPGMFADWLQGAKVSAVIINFVNINLETGRAFLQDLAPEKAIFCHLPLPEDDKTHIGTLAIRNAQRRENELPPYIICYKPGTVIEL